MAVTTAILGALAGCVGGEYAAPTTPAVASAPTTSRAFDCPVTRPTVFDPPPGVAPDALFGAGSSYGNGQLWVGGLGDGGLIVRRPNSDGSIGNKFGWWRGTEGSLRITGRRLDAPAAALRADVPSGYGLEMGVVDDEPMVLGHNGLDPGVSAVVAHHPAAATTIVVLCNHDRGSWAVYLRLAADLGLTEPRD